MTKHAEQLALLLEIKQIADLLNLSLFKVNELRRTDPNFPAPVRLGPRSTRYRRSDVEAYVAALPAAAPLMPPPPGPQRLREELLRASRIRAAA